MASRRIVALLLFVAGSLPAAENPSVPAIISTGFEAFTSKGAEAAWDAWDLANSEMTVGDKTAFVAAASQALKTHGGSLGYELIHTTSVAPSYQIHYVLWRFAQKPMFGVFECYRGDTEWRILRLYFGSDPRIYLPQSVIELPIAPK
jgi:hypothetical protein